MQSMAGTRLVVENRQAFTDEPLPLGVILAGATGAGSVLLNALVKGTRWVTLVIVSIRKKPDGRS